jgi:hypothetical protein
MKTRRTRTFLNTPLICCSKPLYKALFVQVLVVTSFPQSACSLLALPNLFRLTLVGPAGVVSRYYSARALGCVGIGPCLSPLINAASLCNVVWVLDPSESVLRSPLVRSLHEDLVGVHTGFAVAFFVEGYHLRFTPARVVQINRTAMLARLGHFRNLLFVFPPHMRFWFRKRSFFVRSGCLEEFSAVCLYLRMLRDLFPYKLKGLVYDGYLFRNTLYEKDTYLLKPGKKDKQQR